jgi:hypothetical protein
MQPAKTTAFLDEAYELYLNYVSNFPTVKEFAEYQDLTLTQAEYVIKLGREVHVQRMLD